MVAVVEVTVVKEPLREVSVLFSLLPAGEVSSPLPDKALPFDC